MLEADQILQVCQQIGFSPGRKLGSGGSATVVEAVNLADGRKYALKVRRPTDDPAVSTARDTEHEKNMMDSVGLHPHVIRRHAGPAGTQCKTSSC